VPCCVKFEFTPCAICSTNRCCSRLVTRSSSSFQLVFSEEHSRNDGTLCSEPAVWLCSCSRLGFGYILTESYIISKQSETPSLAVVECNNVDLSCEIGILTYSQTGRFDLCHDKRLTKLKVMMSPAVVKQASTPIPRNRSETLSHDQPVKTVTLTAAVRELLPFLSYSNFKLLVKPRNAALERCPLLHSMRCAGSHDFNLQVEFSQFRFQPP
jgi:hypothetical protein